MISRLIKIYTPFICAVTALIHGVLSLCKYKGIIYGILSEVTGHSILIIFYILATSKKMCVWYKITNLLLLLLHFFNFAYYANWITYDDILYGGVIINIIAILSFIAFRVSIGITKILC
jgi:hypothetical protein